LGVANGYVGIENNKKDAIKYMVSACAGFEGIKVLPLKVKYPQGAEKMLIKSILNREVPAGGLPMDVRVVVQNVGTAYAIYEAVRYNRPVVERVVSVTGAGIKNPKNLKVRIGTQIKDVIDYCGGVKAGVSKVIAGGPMMGFALYSTDIPVTKGTSGIVALVEQGLTHYEKYRACIRCGRCIEACPMGLMPQMFSVYVERGFYEDCKDYNLFDCFECGSCTYVCPAKRPIVQQIRLAKTLVKR
ncbi:MAG: RnfABCDGE type electron transport complex subunit C, partial [Candidatus Magnetoovum sp. WYHC-5]|nr:RnfABCDGE type electron transport complex subunit C [Candidatus Magnetoovum sp. WYHC-5]